MRNRCHATSKRTHAQCGNPPMRGKTVCRHHGGKTPTGYGLPQTKHGKYSKVLPVRMAQRYEEAKENQKLWSLRDDLAVCEARLADLFARLDTGESGARWQDLRGAMDQFSAAQDTGDVDGMDRHFARLRQLVTQGSNDYQAWSESYRVWEARCRLTQTEARTLVSMQAMVSVEQLTTMFGVITDAIQRAVLAHTDASSGRKILAAISADFDWIATKEAQA